jgi:outer membrane protein TolC
MRDSARMTTWGRSENATRMWWQGSSAPWQLIPGLLVGVLVFGGCKSAGEHRRLADRTADSIVEEKQQQALGRTEPFSIERPQDTLRRRLLLDQDLAYSGPASLGTRDLDVPRHWPKDDYLEAAPDEDAPAASPPVPDVIHMSLMEALQIGAANSRDYQTRKETIFIDALSLDLERNEFRTQFFGQLEGRGTADLGGDDTVGGVGGTASVGANRRFASGAAITSRIAIDLIKLLTQDRDSSYGIFGDASISIPLLRGAGRHIVLEPLTQAERDVIYSIWDFERFKQIYAVNVAATYLAVLQQWTQVENAEGNYRRLILGTRRAERLAEAGRLPLIQVDQSRQQELQARNRWITAQETFERRMDALKVLLGLPADARVELDRQDLERLISLAELILEELPPMDPPAPPPDQPIRPGPPVPPNIERLPSVDLVPQQQREARPPRPAPDGVVNGEVDDVELVEPGAGPTGPMEIQEPRAVRLALDHRLDLRTREGQVFDAQRRVIVAADALRAGLTLTASGSAGGRRTGLGAAGQPDAQFRPERGFYSTGLLLDLPLERTAQRNFYRTSLISLERSTRSAQELEDQIKMDVRNSLRGLLQARETLQIQARAIVVARRRVESANLELRAGRAHIRDVLEAEESFVSAQNAFTSALVNYRIGELELQRDLGLLEVDHEGLWREFAPEETEPE